MVRSSGPGRWRHRRFKKDREGIGKGSEKFSLYIKGQELPMHDPRGKVGPALSSAASPTGTDHMRAPHDTAFQAPGPNMGRIAPLGIGIPLTFIIPDNPEDYGLYPDGRKTEPPAGGAPGTTDGGISASRTP